MKKNQCDVTLMYPDGNKTLSVYTTEDPYVLLFDAPKTQFMLPIYTLEKIISELKPHWS